jgi:hypothetical protein
LDRAGDVLDQAEATIFQECAVSLKDHDLTESIMKAVGCIDRGALASLQAEVVAGQESSPIHQGASHRDR